MNKLSDCLSDNIEELKKRLPIGKSFDIITRQIKIRESDAYLIGINGMHDVGILQRVLSNLQYPMFSDLTINKVSELISEQVSTGQVSTSESFEQIIFNVVSGPLALIVDGFSEAIIMDLRKYPVRSIEEPDNEKVMRGSKDGFVETMLFNANLIRRRIRNPKLTFQLHQVGSDSKTDVAIAYVNEFADTKILRKIEESLKNLKISSLTLGSKSLEELLVKKRWWNPMPSIQKTERPDVACSYLMEGSIILIVDNSPAVLILPPSIFQFMQSPEDYYKNPITGNIFRALRNICILISLFLLPLLILFAAHYPELTENLSIISENSVTPLQVLMFVIVAEFGLDLMNYAAAHTLGSLTTPLSIVGGLIISDVAIKLSWFSDEVIFYAAVTLLSTLVISSSDFADAMRIYRMLLVITTGLGGLVGFIIGTVLVFLSIITTPTFAGCKYFWPLVPFNWKALKTVLFRIPTADEQPQNVWKRK